MKKGFTLLELIIVIIIIGILATLALTQYGNLIERGRGAEARMILGNLRGLAAAYRLRTGSLTGIATGDLNLGIGAGLISNACAGQVAHYFAYTFAAADPVATFTATRCTANGKPPVFPTAGTLTLAVNYTTGADTWGGTGGY